MKTSPDSRPTRPSEPTSRRRLTLRRYFAFIIAVDRLYRFGKFIWEVLFA